MCKSLSSDSDVLTVLNCIQQDQHNSQNDSKSKNHGFAGFAWGLHGNRLHPIYFFVNT